MNDLKQTKKAKQEKQTIVVEMLRSVVAAGKPRKQGELVEVDRLEYAFLASRELVKDVDSAQSIMSSQSKPSKKEGKGKKHESSNG